MVNLDALSEAAHERSCLAGGPWEPWRLSPAPRFQCGPCSESFLVVRVKDT